MDGLYWRFINRNRNFFLKNPRLSMMVKIFDKMKIDRKKLILSAAEQFIKENTLKWKNNTYQKKYVLFVKNLSYGVRNGNLIGTELNIVLRNVPDNLRYIVFKIKKTFSAIFPRKLINFFIKKFNIFHFIWNKEI